MNVYVRQVCLELSRRGVPTEVFTRRTGNGPERVRLARRSWVTCLPVGPAEAVDKDAVFDLLPDFTAAVLDEMRRRAEAFSLVHSHYWLSGWVAARLKDECGLPWFHTAHTLARVKNERAAEGSVLEPEHRIAVEQAVTRGADRLIASSYAEAEDLARLYGAERNRVSVVPPGVDLRIFHPGTGVFEEAAEPIRTIVFAGRLERLKGAEIALRAFAILSQDPSIPGPLRLEVIGGDSSNGRKESQADGGERARLEQLAKELGIRNRVRFDGPVDQKTLAERFQRAAVCVIPSYSESFGLVALEAQACGTPVVAARVGGLPMIVKDGLTGYTLLTHDPAHYAERIGRLLQDDELRRCFSRRSSLVAARFSWGDTVDRLLAEYARPARTFQPAAAV
jgi:D-inositol-3-phosphate glycosyltransferase